MPLRVIITQGTRADPQEVVGLINDLLAGALLADKAYDTNAIIDAATEQGMEIVIPSKKSYPPTKL